MTTDGGRNGSTRGPRDDKPVLPQRSKDDDDRGWGDDPGDDNDERLRRERPPHW